MTPSEHLADRNRRGRFQTIKHAFPRDSRRWEILVGIFVALGSLATAGYAFVETFWG